MSVLLEYDAGNFCRILEYANWFSCKDNFLILKDYFLSHGLGIWGAIFKNIFRFL